jgi:hypothetical protein
MILTDQQIEYIATNLTFYGIKSEELRSDVIDHICTYIENKETEDFTTAYNEAIQRFGGYAAMAVLERDTYLFTTFKRDVLRKKLVYISGFIATFLISLGILFKFMHWPYANIIFFTGSIILIFIYLPIVFYHKYKGTHQKSISG